MLQEEAITSHLSISEGLEIKIILVWKNYVYLYWLTCNISQFFIAKNAIYGGVLT